MIAPQLWLEPFVGISVDLILYPLWFLVILSSGRLNEFFKFNKQDIFFVAFIAWIILSAAANPIHGLTTAYIVAYIKMFVLYRLIILSINSSDDIRKTASNLIFLAFVIAVEAIMHKYGDSGLGWAGQTLGWVDPSVLEAGGTGRTRWVGIFDGPGVFCVLFTTALPFVLRFLDKSSKFSSKFFGFLLLLVFLLAIWTTGSRGGFLGTLAIFGVYGMNRMKISFGSMIKIGALLVMVYVMAPSHLTAVKDQNKSAQHRVDMWVQGIEMVQQNPVFGIGQGNFQQYTGSLIAHNSAIEIMGEKGLPGLFFWIAMIYLAFKSIYLILQITQDAAYISILTAISISMIGYIVSSMFVTLEYETFYFLLALPRALVRHHKIDIEFNKKDFKIVSATVIVFFIALKAFVMLYY